MTKANRFHADPDEVLASLTTMLNDRREWDELPEWGVVHADAEGRVRTRPLPVPPQMWREAGDPKRLLHLFTSLLSKPPTADAAAQGEYLRRMLPKDFAGLYLRTEGWGAPQARAQEIHQRLQAGGSIPRFETMKDRQELRLATAVDTSGIVYLAQQTRQAMHLEGAYFRGESTDSGLDGKVRGEVPPCCPRSFRHSSPRPLACGRGPVAPFRPPFTHGPHCA
ncbi:hypothetical protein ACF06P_08820 [Streptomyces sp. NPDC015684]|uniref:hypothetical protein n=1 Tax=Streptomyces sp. NPDC015684 TaxID=3364963 RepID=UPI0036FE3646